MGQPLFNRVASVTIGEEGQEGIEISNLRITFQIDKTSESSSNKAKIQIFNMTEANRRSVENENLIVILKAGYAGFEQTPIAQALFIGDVIKASTVKQGTDFITTLEAGDSEKKLLNKRIEKSYESGTFMTTIIKDLSQQLGVAIADISDIVSAQFVNGGVISGKIKDVLDQITERMGISWNVQDGELHVGSTTKTDDATAVELTPDTGLIGSPTRREKGVELMAFINPGLRPNKTIKVESTTFPPGFFRIRKVQYSGDTRGANWFAKIEAI